MVISVSTGLPAAANWPTSVRRSVTSPFERARISVLARSSSAFVERGGCAAQLRVVFVAAAFLLAGALHFGLGGGHFADGLFEGRAGDFQAAQRDGAGIVVIQAFEPVAVLPGSAARWPAPRARGQRRIDAGGAGTDLSTRCFEVGVRAIHCNLKRRLVDSNRSCPASTIWLLRTSTRVTWPVTSAATGTMSACTRACCVYGV